MRRAVAMHFQWEQLYKAGTFPILPLFDVEPLNMDLDVPALIRGVRQPVLAIFGDSEMPTPPLRVRRFGRTSWPPAGTATTRSASSHTQRTVC